MRNQNTLIELENVSKTFGHRQVLHHIDLRLESGKIYGLIGHNGAGKSVMLKCICGFYRCSGGCVRVNGKELGKDQDVLPDAGIIIDEPGFLHYWDGYHNLEFLYTIRNRRNKKYICEVLEKVGLSAQNKGKVGKYSLGMKQRLAIAQAIMEDPQILILDEPMNGLDHTGIDEMRRLFLDMKEQGKLIILASHNKEDIEMLCDEVYEMENGSLSRLAPT